MNDMFCCPYKLQMKGRKLQKVRLKSLEKNLTDFIILQKISPDILISITQHI